MTTAKTIVTKNREDSILAEVDCLEKDYLGSNWLFDCDVE